MKTENKLLMCVSCKRRINAEVEKCPQCGKKDPFMFGKVEKKAIGLISLDIFLSFVLAIKICSFISAALYILAILLWILTAVFAKIGGFFIKHYIDDQIFKLNKEVTNIYGSNKDAYEWQQVIGEKMRDLLKYF